MSRPAYAVESAGGGLSRTFGSRRAAARFARWVGGVVVQLRLGPAGLEIIR